MVEHDLAKVGVASSSLVSRSKIKKEVSRFLFLFMNEDYFIYLLESEKSGVLYVGLSVNPELRLIQHNQRKSKFTSGHIPWKLIYTEKAGDLQNARKLEKYYKSAAGKRRLKKILGLE